MNLVQPIKKQWFNQLSSSLKEKLYDINKITLRTGWLGIDVQ